MSQEEKFDGILYTMVSSSGGYEGFFDQIFGFLRRKTDFFTDFKKAEQVIATIGKKHIEAYAKESNLKEASKVKQPDVKKEAPSEPKSVPQKAPVPDLISMNEQKKIPEIPKINQPADDIIKKESISDPTTNESEKLLPGPGNGSKTDNYLWTQTLEEVQFTVPINKNLRAKDLTINLDINHCYIATKDKAVIYVNGDWCDKIHPDETMWTIEEANGQKSIEITVTKWKNANSWWDCLLKGEPVIDTQKINPETSKLSDLDGEMKSTVEKMMFDMNQKQKGLPSSDELQKQEKLKEFMKAHPEMDFSKAKFG